MAYVINKSDGSEFAVLEDATVNTSSSITLVGKNFIGYGEAQNENFLFLLENFANNAPPRVPLKGQLWFDTTNNTVKVFDSGDKWVEVGAAALSLTPPPEPPAGAFWFKTSSKTLHTWNGVEWVLIGPEAVDGFGTTRALSRSILDTTNTAQPIIELIVNDVTVGIISSSTFSIAAAERPLGFSDLKAGITLADYGFVLKGDLDGVAAKATRLEHPILLNGTAFDGSVDTDFKAETKNRLVSGDYISGTDFDGSNLTTWSVDATSSNTIGKVVARNNAGDFAAGTITANLVGNVTGNVTASSGTSAFDIVTANTFVGAQLTGNSLTTTRLATPRNINGVLFDGTADVTITADANTLTGTNLANNVKTSALESLGTLTSLSVAGSVVLDSNLTLEGTGDAEISALRKILITVNDSTDDASLQLISPQESVDAGLGSRGSLAPVTDSDVDLGKSSLKYNNAYANNFYGDLTGNATSATTAGISTHLAGGNAGSIAYQTAPGTTAMLAPGISGYVLRSGGTGAPTWGPMVFATMNVGDYLTGANYDGVTASTLAVDASTGNVGDKVVARDSSGNFSAGIITASLSGNASTATAFETPRTINGVTFDGTGNIIITATDPNAVAKSGSTMTGKLTLDGNPTASLHAATKQYVDSQSAPYTITYGNTVYSTAGFTNQVGSFNDSRNFFDVFPPSGKTMSNLIAFIPSIAMVHYAGGVDGNDSIRCTYQQRSDRVRVWVQNTEQRSTPAANYLAVWS